MRALVAKLYQRVSNFTIAAVLAVSSLTALVPFILSQNASAAGVIHFSDLSAWDLTQTRATGHNEITARKLLGITILQT